MCGIGGTVRFDGQPIDAAVGARLLRALRARGPDDEGVARFERCELVHRRLSIIDHERGQQPMVLRAGESGAELAVVFNGMIYNHRLLRRELEALGHRFQSDHSDTEVLLHGYRQWGRQLPGHLDGMFAFAIWSDAERRLFLCRDRMGKKPLYLQRSESELRFASLIAGLADDGASVNQRALMDYLRFGYTFDSSLVDGIEQLPAGHWMQADAQGHAKLERYWQPPAAEDRGSGGAVDVQGLIEQAVAVRLDADVPLGCFLSGGIDSTVLAAIAQRELVNLGGGPLQTFTVAMPDTDYDESAFARQVAAHIGSRHVELPAVADFAEHGRQVMNDLEYLTAHIGEPLGDSSLLPTYWISRAASEHVKVALSGDGGDELFGGYERYRAMRLLRRHAWWLRCLPHGLVKRDADQARSRRTRAARLIEAAARPTPSGQYRQITQLFSDDQIRRLGVTIDEADDADAGLADWPADLAAEDAASAAMRWDLLHYLPHDLLRKVDRASMAAGLEVRCPLLDRKLVEATAAMPSRQMIVGWQTKVMLRRLAAELVPQAIARRPKQGFAVPIGRWFRTVLRDDLIDRICGGRLEAMGFDGRAVRAMVDEHVNAQADHSHRLFALLGLAMWAERSPKSCQEPFPNSRP